MKYKIKVSHIIILLFLTAVFLMAFNSAGDFDTGFHLATGKYIYTNHIVPKIDVFSFISNGASLVAHYWLTDLIFYIVWLCFGLGGLISFVALLSVLTYFFIILTAKKWVKNLSPLFIILVPIIYFTAELWVIRPQIFSYLLTAITIYILSTWVDDKNTKLIYFLPILFILWANLHAGVVLGIAIILLYIFDGIRRFWGVLKRIKKSLIIMFGSILVTLLNPNGYLVLIYSKIIEKPAKEMNVMEWKSILSFLNVWQSRIFLIIISLAFLYVIFRVIKRANNIFDLDLTSIGLISASAILPIISIRHVGFFPILMTPALIKEIGLYTRDRAHINIDVIIKISSIILVCFMFIAGILHIYNIRTINKHLLPVTATDLIMKYNPPGEIFNTMEEGGYLMWKLFPKYKIFIDGRSEVYVGQAINDYKGILFKVKDWEKIFDDFYNINIVVLRYRKWSSIQADPIILEFAKTLAKEKGFTLVSWDDSSLMFVRNIDDNKELISKYGYKIIGPYNDPTKIPKEKWSEAEVELNNALKRGGGSSVLEKYAFDFLLNKKELLK